MRGQHPQPPAVLAGDRGRRQHGVWVVFLIVILDHSRPVSPAGGGKPTGIDGVELAYAEHLIAADPSARFAATTALGGLGLVPRDRAEGFVATIAAAWRGNPAAVGDERRVRRLARRSRLAALLGGERRLLA